MAEIEDGMKSGVQTLEKSLNGLCATIADKLDAVVDQLESDLDITPAVKELRRVARIVREQFT